MASSSTDAHGNKYEIRSRHSRNGICRYEVHAWITSPCTTTIMVEGSLAKCDLWIDSQLHGKPEARSLDVRSQSPAVGTRSRVGQPGEAVWTGAGWWTGD